MNIMPVGPTGSGAMNMWIMQSQQYTDELVNMFEKAAAAGYNPNTIYADVFRNVGCRESDLTSSDKIRLQKKVAQLSESAKSRH